MLRDAHRRIANEILRAGLNRNETARLRALQDSVGAMLSEAYGTAKSKAIRSMGILAGVESRAAMLATAREHNGLLTSIGTHVAKTTALAVGDLSDTLLDIPVHGGTFGDWWKAGAAAAVERVRREVQYGLVMGQNPTEIARRIFMNRDATGQTGGAAWKGSRTALRMVIRTVTTSIQARAAIIGMRESGITRCRFEAVLDDRTSIICAGFDGTEWDLDDPKLPIPALHPNCRSALVPIITWTSGPNAGKAIANARTGYEDWLKSQDEATQNRVLGKGRADLWRRSKVSLREMISTDRRPITLKALEDALRPPAAVLDEILPSVPDAIVPDAPWVMPEAAKAVFREDGSVRSLREMLIDSDEYLDARDAAGRTGNSALADRIAEQLTERWEQGLKAYSDSKPPIPPVFDAEVDDIISFSSWTRSHPEAIVARAKNMGRLGPELHDRLENEYNRLVAMDRLARRGDQLPPLVDRWGDVRSYSWWESEHPAFLRASLGDGDYAAAIQQAEADYARLVRDEIARLGVGDTVSLEYEGELLDKHDWVSRHPLMKLHGAAEWRLASRDDVVDELEAVYDRIVGAHLTAKEAARKAAQLAAGMDTWVTNPAHLTTVSAKHVPANLRGERAVGAGRSAWRFDLLNNVKSFFPDAHPVWQDPRVQAWKRNPLFAPAQDAYVEALQEALDVEVKAFAESAHPWVRVPDDVFDLVLNDGKFKNQYQTGTSRGMNNPRIRLEAENALFGYDFPGGIPMKDKHWWERLKEDYLAQRPVYGYISDDAFGDWGRDGVSQYGAIRIRLKSSVRERTTVTAGDSLGFAAEVKSGKWADGTVRDLDPGTMALLARPLNALDSRFLNANMVSGRKAVASLREALWKNVHYVEAQYHGGLSVDDIAEVVFPAGGYYGAIQARLRQLGIPFRIKP